MSNTEFKCLHHMLVELLIEEMGLERSRELVKKVVATLRDEGNEELADGFLDQMVMLARTVRAKKRIADELAKRSDAAVAPLRDERPLDEKRAEIARNAMPPPPMTVEDVEARIQEMFPGAKVVRLTPSAEKIIEEVPEHVSKMLGYSECDCARCSAARKQRLAEHGEPN